MLNMLEFIIFVNFLLLIFFFSRQPEEEYPEHVLGSLLSYREHIVLGK